MPTKEEILNEFALLPEGTLQKLHSYSGLIVIPDADLLTSVNMVQLKEYAMAQAATLFPEWDDKSNSDFGAFLVEIMGLFSEKDFWYINAFANESTLFKMRNYASAFLRAVELGHSPILCKGATAIFTISAIGSVSATDYLPGQLKVKNESGVYFTNLSSFTIPLGSDPVSHDVTLVEGRLVSNNLSYNGYGIRIPDKFVDVESISVERDGVTWTRVRNFGQSISSNTHFMVLPDSDGRATILFGDGTYGKTPDINDSFSVSYIVCSGSLGNQSVQAITIESYVSSRALYSVTQTDETTGGSDPESLSSLRNSPLNYFANRKAVINAPSVVQALNARSGIKQSKCIIIGNIVTFYVQPDDGSIAGSTLLTELETFLEDLIVEGFTTSGNTTIYKTCGPIALETYFLRGFGTADNISRVKQLIQDYTNPLVLAKYGDDFSLTDLTLLLKGNIPGLQNIVYTTVAGGSPADVSVGPFELKSKVALVDIAVTSYEIS